MLWEFVLTYCLTQRPCNEKTSQLNFIVSPWKHAAMNCECKPTAFMWKLCTTESSAIVVWQLPGELIETHWARSMHARVVNEATANSPSMSAQSTAPSALWTGQNNDWHYNRLPLVGRQDTECISRSRQVNIMTSSVIVRHTCVKSPHSKTLCSGFHTDMFLGRKSPRNQ